GALPSNDRKFMDLLEYVQQPYPLKYADIGFGSSHYPNYCIYAIDVANGLAASSGFVHTIPLFFND
ncbi:hypothetical protein, partial [Maribacter flavus]|uniref:hypothetical protein n=1 Tax=Maribacter flavus TaxID=1658664 RepID=UPI003D350F97